MMADSGRKMRGRGLPAGCTVTPRIGGFSDADFDDIDKNARPMGSESVGEPEYNRYRNILPNVETRVKLSKWKGAKGLSYVNANFVHGHAGFRRAYIAAQAPKEVGLSQWWRMIWQEDVRVIVMLTRLEEKGRAKCTRYWPDLPSEVMDQAGISVENVKMTRDPAGFISTKLTLSKKGAASRDVWHFWFDQWPDLGVPADDSAGATLIRIATMASSMSSQAKSPMLVHCSAGIGRTGVFIGLDRGLDSLHFDGEFDLKELIGSLRKDRGGLVQTHEQATFLVDLLRTHVADQQRLDPVRRSIQNPRDSRPAPDGPAPPPPPAPGARRTPAALPGAMSTTLEFTNPNFRANRGPSGPSSGGDPAAGERRKSSVVPFKIHSVTEALSASNANDWALRVLAPRSPKCSSSSSDGAQAMWQLSTCDNGRFVVRNEGTPGVFILSLVYKQRVTEHMISMAADGKPTTINGRVYGDFGSVQDVIAALSSQNLPRDTSSHRPWPIRLKTDETRTEAEIVAACVAHLSLPENIAEEGLFRISADAAELEKLTDNFLTDPAQTAITLVDYDVNTVACHLKRRFRELPEPIIGGSMYGAWLGSIKLPSPAAQVGMVKKLAKRLPEASKAILSALLPFLNRVAEHEGVNKMSTRALAVVWGPTLIPAPEGADPLAQLEQSGQVIKLMLLLLEEYAGIFEAAEAAPITAEAAPSTAAKSRRDTSQAMEAQIEAMKARVAAANDLEGTVVATAAAATAESSHATPAGHRAPTPEFDLEDESTWLHPETQGKAVAFQYMASNGSKDDGVYMVEKHTDAKCHVLNVLYKGKPRRFLLEPSNAGLIVNSKIYDPNIRATVDFIRVISQQPLLKGWPVELTRCIQPRLVADFKVGDRVRYLTDKVDCLGVVRFAGLHVHKGLMRYGVELDRAVGLNNGTISGHGYFSCADGHGVLARPDRITAEEDHDDEPAASADGPSEPRERSMSNVSIEAYDNMMPASPDDQRGSVLKGELELNYDASATSRVITLNKGPNGFGLQFTGAKTIEDGERRGWGVLIKGKKPGGSAEHRPDIQVGWQILKVGNVDLAEGMTSDLKAALREIDDSITLSLQENPELSAAYGIGVTPGDRRSKRKSKPSSQPPPERSAGLGGVEAPDVFAAISGMGPAIPLSTTSPLVRSDSFTGGVIEMSIQKAEGRKLGLQMLKTEEGIVIQKVHTSGLAYETGIEAEGMRIIAVNGKDTAHVSKRECLQLIAAKDDVVVISLLPPGVPIPTAVDEMPKPAMVRALSARRCVQILRAAGVTIYKDARTGKAAARCCCCCCCCCCCLQLYSCCETGGLV